MAKMLEAPTGEVRRGRKSLGRRAERNGSKQCDDKEPTDFSSSEARVEVGRSRPDPHSAVAWPRDRDRSVPPCGGGRRSNQRASILRWRSSQLPAYDHL